MWGAVTIVGQIIFVIVKYYLSKSREKVVRDEERKRFHRENAAGHADYLSIKFDELRKKTNRPPRRPNS